MNKKNKQFFWTNISEENMKDTNLYITEDSKPINLSTWERVKLETNWEQKENEWRKWKKEFSIRHQKSIMRTSIVGVFVGLLGTASSYTSSVWAFKSIDSSYAERANIYIGFSAVGFALLAGVAVYTAIKSAFDWFYARKKLHELSS